MPRSFLSAALLAVLVLATSAFAPAQDRPANDEAAVRAVVARFFDTFNAHDAEGQAALYADDAQLFWGEGELEVVSDRAAFLEAGRQWHAQAAAMRATQDGPMTVRFLTDDIATVFVDAFFRMGDQPMGRANALLVLQHTPDGWLITALHEAFVPSSEG